MKILIFGGGDLARAFASVDRGDDIVTLSKAAVDVRDFQAVGIAIHAIEPDFIICTAGLSDRVIGVTMKQVVETNLLGPMNVGQLAAAYGKPCLLVASTAGMSPGTHSWYGPAKAGVINFVRAMANGGARIWAISPGRMRTKMRSDDFPDEHPETQVSTQIVSGVIDEIIAGHYAPGANVVVRKVGTSGRVDIYEEVAPCLPSLL